MKLDHRSYFRFFGALSAALLVAHQSHAQPAAYPTVTDDRLEHPDAGDWLMYRRTYDGSGFSPLKQITPSTIRRLTLAWTVSTDLLGAHETTPIVNRGRMFITTPQNNIIALDAKTGTQLWRYARKYPEGLFQLHPTNRGVALYGDYVYMATTDCALVALDAATGKEVWTVTLDDYKTGCYSTLAPLAVRGKIILGYSGGELGVRGSVNAFDAATGKRIWKTYTVPAPNEPGGDSWKGDTFKRGGGSTWFTGVYDPVTNTTYWGTGNPGPWVADDRPGDNLYTDSTLALEADTGKLKSYHQYTPHDSWDWDEVSAPLLIDTEVDGKLTKTATHAGRNGLQDRCRRGQIRKGRWLVGGARSSGAISEHQGRRSFGFQRRKDASGRLAVEFRIGHAHLSLCESEMEGVRRSASATLALHEPCQRKMRMSMTPRASANMAPADGSRRDILVGIARGALAGPAMAIGSDVAAQPSPAPLPRVTEAVTPFRVVTSSAAISDARRRLQATRWPERQTTDDWRQGVPLATIQALVAYWRTAYDWRRLERRLNAYPQFRTEIDGLGIHFLHVRSPHEHARPIILTHGWPGSIVEFLNVIDPLTNPTKHGGQPEDVFHVVLPSLPGFGFSDKPIESGWGLPRIARAWSVLMRRLGYTDYLAQGGDWGAGVTTWMAKQHVEGLAVIHLNLPILFPPPVEGEPNQAEKAAIAQLVAFNDQKSGYAKIQSTRPQTIGYALADSPAGQAAWIYEKLGEWTDSNYEPEREISRDEMLDNISLYWLTDTAASSARLYYESFGTDFSTQRLDLPVAVSIFPGELFLPPRLWGERVYSRLFYWNEAARGGHFAAFEQPAVFVEELRAAFRALPRGG